MELEIIFTPTKALSDARRCCNLKIRRNKFCKKNNSIEETTAFIPNTNLLKYLNTFI